MCFLIESPMERHADEVLSRLINCNGVPVKEEYSIAHKLVV